jgi:hypothetical protein
MILKEVRLRIHVSFFAKKLETCHRFSIADHGCQAEFFLAGENDDSSHDLALMLSREDSLIDRGINETLTSAHRGQTKSSLIFRRVALQKHDLQSTKCRSEVLLSRIKFSIMVLLFVCIFAIFRCIKLIIVVKRENVDDVILYSVRWIYFYHTEYIAIVR